jgi:hypothetical protein
MKILRIIGALFAVVASAHGRIGETKQQVNVRYGKPLIARNDAEAEASAYAFRGFKIIVYFENGVSVMEKYWKSGHAPMSAAEIAGLLSANALNSRREPSQEGFEFYYREKKRFGVYNALSNEFMICVPDAINRIVAHGNALDSKRMKDF